MIKKSYQSKNPSIILKISNDLSVLVGLARIATWDTLGRPSKPKKGTIGFNVQTQSLEIWEGHNWFTAHLDPI